MVWALPRSLATTYGITIVFFSSGYLDVSVLRVCLHCWITLRLGCPIRIFVDQDLFAAPHNFSQLITSFIASESLGIRHTLLVTFLFAFTVEYLYLNTLHTVKMSKNFHLYISRD